MKKIVFLIIFLTSYFNYAHTSEFNLDDPFPIEFSEIRKYSEHEFLGLIGERMIFETPYFTGYYDLTNESFTAISYTDNPFYKTLRKEKNIEDVSWKSTKLIGGTVYAFYTFEERLGRLETKKYLAYLIYDPDANQFLKPEDNVMLELPGKNPFVSAYSSKLGLYLNADNTILRLVRLLDREENQPLIFKVYEFNAQMKEVETYENVIPAIGNDLYLSNPIFDNEGNFYFQSKERNKGAKAGKKDDKWHFRIYNLRKDEAEANGVELKKEYLNFMNIRLYLNKYGKVNCAGYYHENRREGIYQFNLNNEQVLKTPLSAEKTKAWYSNEDADNDMNYSFSRHKLKKVIQTNDSELLVLSEQSWNSSTSQGSEIFYRDSVLISMVNSSGELKWTAVIDKDQRSVSDGAEFSSFFHYLNDTHLYVFFNENKALYTSNGTPIRKKELEDIKFQVTKTVPDFLVMVKIDLASGDVMQKAIYNNVENLSYCLINSSFSDEANNRLFFSSRNRKKSLARDSRIGIIQL